ncbi:hypothetical protein NPS53_09780 [Pseudomonas putida]|uniref:hypothetical protein n=1 Tax=Pseudomonas putida TaxID=303 RepID=UPI002363217B|nr:hypothetical protein [Pseudomonas putida]MDD2139868.1 hypothetical protein [Pseudomonas putida]HDS1721791.1 hypothetical protein [Pseudomonas putida]
MWRSLDNARDATTVFSKQMSKFNTPASYTADAYKQQLNDARARLVTTGKQLLDWLSRLDESAASEFIHLEPMRNLFPTCKRSDTFRLLLELHLSEKRYGTLGIALRTDSMRTDLSSLTTTELAQLLRPFCGAQQSKEHAAAFQRLVSFNKRVAALRFLGVEFDVPLGGGPVLPRWFEALEAYGTKCRPLLEERLTDFIRQSACMDEAMFEFNSMMGKVRYRSIRCTYTLDDVDPLGPSDPALKVVTSINPATSSRRYNRMADFKKALKKKQIGKDLRRDLGRDPSKEEIEQAITALRPRRETDWITTKVIKACHLGRLSRDVFEAQTNLVAVMQPWNALRSQLQALLP